MGSDIPRIYLYDINQPLIISPNHIMVENIQIWGVYKRMLDVGIRKGEAYFLRNIAAIIPEPPASVFPWQVLYPESSPDHI